MSPPSPVGRPSFSPQSKKIQPSYPSRGLFHCLAFFLLLTGSVARGQDNPVPEITSPLEVRFATHRAFSYQITTTGEAGDFEAENLPESLVIDERTGIISGFVGDPGDYRVEISAANAEGRGTATLVMTVVEPAAIGNLRILQLGNNNGSEVAATDTSTGDGLPGIATGHERVLVTGTNSTVSVSLDPAKFEDVEDWRVQDTRYEGLVSDLATGRVYVLADDDGPRESGTAEISRLIEINPLSGQASGPEVGLSFPIAVGNQNGVFNGNGRVVIHNGSRAFDLIIATGEVTDLGAMTAPAWFDNGGWAAWGVAEFFDDRLHLAYRGSGDDSARILRTRVPDGQTETIATFADLGADLASWTISPINDRWYFQHRGFSQFGSSAQILGSARAVIDIGDPITVPTILGPEERRFFPSDFRYQIRAKGFPTSFGASGLPEGLTLDAATGEITGEVVTPGDYPVELSATNSFGTTTVQRHFRILAPPSNPTLQIRTLSNTGVKVIDHNPLTGNDRAGVAVGRDRVLVTGVRETASFDLVDLSSGIPLGTRFDGLISDLSTGTIFALAINGVSLPGNRGAANEANQLIEIDPESGQFTPLVIPLSETIRVGAGGGIFSGNGRFVIHNSEEAIEVEIATGQVTSRTAMERPEWFNSRGLAIFGVAEYFGGDLYLAYRGPQQSILRTRVRDGFTETIAEFTNLSDLASWTISPVTNRWYFHFRNNSEFGTATEALGYADAEIEIGAPVEPPLILAPENASSPVGQDYRLEIRASQAAIQLESGDLPPGLTFEVSTGIISGTPTTAGTFPIEISATNDIGTSTKVLTLTVFEIPPDRTLRIVELAATGSKVIDHDAITGDDRAGIAVGFDRVFVTGDRTTGSFNLIDIEGGISLGTRYDSIFSDLSTGAIYSFAFDGAPYLDNQPTINQLLEIDQQTGDFSGSVIHLSRPIPMTNSLSGVFSGAGRVALYNNNGVFDINLATGYVRPFQELERPAWVDTEGWATWGVAEHFDGDLYLTYHATGQNLNQIRRTRVSDGFTETVSTFDNLGFMGNWTISPLTNRWYFHNEGQNQFGGSRETLGYADAVIELGAALDPPRIFTSANVRALSGREVSIPLRFSEAPDLVAVDGLPPGLIYDPANNEISGIPTTGGDFRVQVSATNELGTSTTMIDIQVLTTIPLGEFKIVSLEASNSKTIDHSSFTGDDRGGIAVSFDRVFVTGDSASASFGLDGLAGGTRIEDRIDGLCSDLANGLVYTLAFNGVPHQSGTTEINQLIELDPITGQSTNSPPIALSQTIPVTGNSGVFSGGGRVAIHNGSEVFEILTATGAVRALGTMPRPSWAGTENWAAWGVAEFFNDDLYLTYRDGRSQSIVRTRVPDGPTETIATFSNLGELATWTVSPLTNRWYFSHERSSQFGDGSEVLGYADALIESGEPTSPPEFRNPSEFEGLVNQVPNLQIRTTGQVTRFSATGLPEGLILNADDGSISGSVTTPGTYTFDLSATNVIGTSTQRITLNISEIAPPQDLRIISLTNNGITRNGISNLIGDDRGGIAVSSDRVLATGDSATASFDLDSLGDGQSFNQVADGIFSDLASGKTYVFGLDGVPFRRGTDQFNEILEIDPVTGEETGLRIRLSEAIPIVNNSGVFSGAGRVVIHSSNEVFDIELATGLVTNLGAMPRPIWQGSEGWAIWGVAEFFEGELYLAYRSAGGDERLILRTRVPDGETEVIATFFNMGDLASWTVSPDRQRWYFFSERSDQFGGNTETLGFADAVIEMGDPTEPPVFPGPPRVRILRGNLNYQVEALGSPTRYGITGLPQGLTFDPATGLISGNPTVSGEFNLEVSATNDLGTSTFEFTLEIFDPLPAPVLRIEDLQATGSKVASIGGIAGNYRPVIAVGRDQVLAAGSNQTVSLGLLQLDHRQALSTRYSSLCSDLSTGRIYTLAFDGIPFQDNDPEINQLLEIDPDTGDLSGRAVNFDDPIPLAEKNGIFSGMGRVVIHNGFDVFDLHLASESNSLLGPMERPRWWESNQRIITGVAEYFDGKLHLAYRGTGDDRQSLFRTRIPDGETEAISTFEELGFLGAWSVDPLTRRWYFSYNTTVNAPNQFGGSGNTVGYADAILTLDPPTEVPEIFIEENFTALTDFPLNKRIIASGSPTSFAASNLPAGLTLDTATGVISGSPETAGEFPLELSATNGVGTSTTTVTWIISEIPSFPTFRIRELNATGSKVVDHDALTGDDRGGIAVGLDRVLLTGDSSTASFGLEDLEGGISFSQIYDSLCSDLADGVVYTLAYDGNPHRANDPFVNGLLRIDPETGQTGELIPLSETITVLQGTGVFSGAGRIVIHNRTEVFDIHPGTGTVISRGPMTPPNWANSESWASWGVAEFFDDELHLAYRDGNGTSVIQRARVPDGRTEEVASFENLGDLASWTVSPITSRWYFHHERNSQFGGDRETLGYADAVLELGPPTAPPSFVDLDFGRAAVGSPFEFRLRVFGQPTSISVGELPEGIAFDSTTGLFSGTPTSAGIFSIEVSATNSFGTASRTLTLEVFQAPPVGELRIRSMSATGAEVIDHSQLTGDDRGGIAVGFDRVLVTGDMATASFGLERLGNGVSLGTRYDSLCSDLQTGVVFTLGFDGAPHNSGGQTINQLLEIDPGTGSLTGLTIPLSESITVPNSAAGVFSGAGRVVIHNGTEVFDILIETGTVNALGPMARPLWANSESWAIWGVAEFFDDQLYLSYRSNSGNGQSFVRSPVPEGPEEVIASFTNLGDLASWTVSPGTQRWYFHSENGNELGRANEALGFADAEIEVTIPEMPPFFGPLDPVQTLAGREVNLQLRTFGGTNRYEADGLPPGLTLNTATGLISGSITVPGSYSVEVSAINEFGTTRQSLEFIAPGLNGKRVALFADDAFVDPIREADNVRLALVALGYEVLPFIGTSPADWEAAFDTGIVIIPDLEVAPLALPSDTREVISRELDNDKALIMLGSATSYDEDLLNDLRGWSLSGSIIDNDGTLTSLAPPENFPESPAELSAANGSYLLRANTLPDTATTLYVDTNNNVAAFLDRGIGYLAYDWYSGPRTEWDLVLNEMIVTLLSPGLQEFRLAGSQPSIPEGDQGETQVSFTVTRSGNLESSGSVDWSIDLTPANLTESDFTASSGSLVFPSGVSEQTLEVAIASDLVVELDETFTVSLSNPQGLLPVVIIDESRAEATILNDDRAIMTLSGDSRSEGDQGAPVLTFSATLDHPVDVAVGGLFATLAEGGTTATEGTDFVGNPGREFAIPPLQTEASVTVTILPDNLAEPDEIVQALLDNFQTGGRDLTLAGDGSNLFSATILNDDFAPAPAADGPYEVTEDSFLTVEIANGVLANDDDQDDGADSLTAILMEEPVNGTLVFAEDGSFSYTPDPDYFGPDSFTYRASDGLNESAETEVTLAVLEAVDLSPGIDVLQTPLVAGGEVFDTFRVTVSNGGPSTATNVVLALTSVLPEGVLLANSVASAGIFDGESWRIDSLAEDSGATLVIGVQVSPNAASGSRNLPLTIEVASVNQPEINLLNNQAGASVSIISAADTETTVTATPALERQSGLLVDKVTVTNNNSESIPAFRLYVGQLPEDVQVYNAHGTRPFGDPPSEKPYLLYNQPLAPGASVILTVELFRPSLVADFTPAYEIELLPFEETIPADDPNQTNLEVARQEILTNGDFLIEIASEAGAIYAVEYSGDMVTWDRSSARITAVANRLQWIDSGPPKTKSHPSGSSNRYYRFVLVAPAPR